MADTKPVPIHRDDKLHAILDALNVWENHLNTDPSLHPWDEYDGSFGGPGDYEDDQPTPPEARRATYLAQIEQARFEITRKLDLGEPL